MTSNMKSNTHSNSILDYVSAHCRNCSTALQNRHRPQITAFLVIFSLFLLLFLVLSLYLSIFWCWLIDPVYLNIVRDWGVFWIFDINLYAARKSISPYHNENGTSLNNLFEIIPNQILAKILTCWLHSCNHLVTNIIFKNDQIRMTVGLA